MGHTARRRPAFASIGPEDDGAAQRPKDADSAAPLTASARRPFESARSDLARDACSSARPHFKGDVTPPECDSDNDSMGHPLTPRSDGDDADSQGGWVSEPDSELSRAGGSADSTHSACPGEGAGGGAGASSSTCPEPMSQREEKRDAHLLFTGEGTLSLLGGATYSGQIADGRAHGQGRFTLPSGDSYEGEFALDQANGEGTWRGTDGRVYAGQWLNDTQHGEGTEVLANGRTYTGCFVAGQKQGDGRYEWKDGAIYDGQFEDNHMHGQGVYIWHCGDSGRKYEGEWFSSKMHGQGKYSFSCGANYIGQYRHGQKHGGGTFTWPDGRSYTGQWSGGKQDGHGVMTNTSGETVHGRWECGRFARAAFGPRGGAPDAGLGLPNAPYSSRSLSSRRTATNSARAWVAQGSARQEPGLGGEAHRPERTLSGCGADCAPESEVMPPMSERATSLTARSGGSLPAGGRPIARRQPQSGFGLYVDLSMPTSQEEGLASAKLVL